MTNPAEEKGRVLTEKKWAHVLDCATAYLVCDDTTVAQIEHIQEWNRQLFAHDAALREEVAEKQRMADLLLVKLTDARDTVAARADKAEARIAELEDGLTKETLHCSMTKLRVERLEKALREIAEQPCDLKCDLKDGSHFSDCVAVSDAVDIARRALEEP